MRVHHHPNIEKKIQRIFSGILNEIYTVLSIDVSHETQ
jgi:hypothetical protein